MGGVAARLLCFMAVHLQEILFWEELIPPGRRSIQWPQGTSVPSATSLKGVTPHFEPALPSWWRAEGFGAGQSQSQGATAKQPHIEGLCPVRAACLRGRGRSPATDLTKGTPAASPLYGSCGPFNVRRRASRGVRRLPGGGVVP